MNRYDFIIEQVRAAGELLMRLREEKFETLTKGNDPRDIVTSVDIAVNNFLVGKIREVFPEDAIYSEENENKVTEAPALWAIDPIDGSSNFSRGIPHFSICIAFLQNGVPETGAVYNPVTNELFSFQKGGGAFLNGKPIRVSQETELKNAFVLLHAGRKQELWDWGGESYRQLLEHAKKTGNLSGSALDTCFVAAGRVEANIYGTLSTLDIAAAIGILLEAGGVIVNQQGESVTLTSTPQRVIATNSMTIANALRTII
ncbi:MAG: inositol monophosphatase family protein [Candidatus Kaiserbacteria bacterium]|nr:inositol monophosphatase family protein [Candidatus Kaiserbacteria bacterium]